MERPGKILVGVTSWTEKTLIESGQFYPQDVTTPEDRLRYYADQFPITEVDSSYYGIPAERNSVLWVERTPRQFIFHIKAFRLLTQHQTPLSAIPKDLRSEMPPFDKNNVYLQDLPEEVVNEIWIRFGSSLEPLKQAGKLGAVLFQFPGWYFFRRARLEYLAQCRARLPGYRVAIEFRSQSWLSGKNRERVLSFEEEHGLIHVAVDEPQGFTHSIPQVWEVTSPALAVVRLHGRNAETWQKKGLRSAAERFNYVYSDEELSELVQPIQSLKEHAKEVHVLLNNCYRDYGTRNAAALQALFPKRQGRFP